jgi:hypothetical protein
VKLEAELTELAGHLNAANYRFLVLLAEFDRREGWVDWATHSCAHWLNWKLGINLGAAREKVRVAHALENLPLISAAMARGELSYCKVRALTRVADHSTEEYLLSVAQHGTVHHVEKLVQVFRRSKEAEELSREACQQANRILMWRHDPDGSLVVNGRLPAEAGAVFIKALEAAMHSHPAPGVSHETSERPPSLGARRVDALGVIAESFLAHGSESLNGGERQQIVVHVDVETLKERSAGRCELEDGPVMAAETARRLACDASIVRIIENEHGEPLDVGRKTRSIPPAIRRALNARDRGCRFPGCPHTRHVDGHHIEHWANGGETKLANLVLLCRFHHRLVHEGGVEIQRLDDGALRFVGTDGRCFESVAPDTTTRQYDWTRIPDLNRHAGVAITPKAAATRWLGEAMDYNLAIDGLLVRWRKGKKMKNVSPETSAGG